MLRARLSAQGAKVTPGMRLTLPPLSYNEVDSQLKYYAASGQFLMLGSAWARAGAWQRARDTLPRRRPGKRDAAGCRVLPHRVRR